MPVISIVGLIAVPILIVAAITWKLVKWWKSDPDPVRTLKLVGYLSLAILGVLGIAYLILFFTYAKSDLSIACLIGFFFVVIYFCLLVVGIKVLNTDSDELFDSLRVVAKGVGCAAALAVVGVVGCWIYQSVSHSVSEAWEQICYDPMVSPPKDAKPVATPTSFCGVNFGERIDQSYRFSPLKVDKGLDRSGFSNMSRSHSGGHERSYWTSSYRPDTSFRGFNSGTVSASWSSRKIYSVGFVYDLPRNRTTSADEAEFEAACKAITQKYGVEPIDCPAGLDRLRVFWLGDVRVTLKWISEGMVDRARLELTACNMKIDAEAEKESLAYYEELSRASRNKVQEGGSDAL